MTRPDRRQAVGVILNVVGKEWHQAGEDQEIAAAAGDTALNGLEDGGMAYIALQQIAPQPAGDQKRQRRGDGGGGKREQRAGQRAEEYSAGDHQQAAGDQAQGGNDK